MHERDRDVSCPADATAGYGSFEQADHAGRARGLHGFVRALSGVLCGSVASFARFLGPRTGLDGFVRALSTPLMEVSGFVRALYAPFPTGLVCHFGRLGFVSR